MEKTPQVAPSTQTPPQAPPPVNPLLARIQMPGETFTLPSGGIFYNNEELDESVKNAEVRVHPMTAIDEIVLRTPDMLFSGDAVRQVFTRCIPQVSKPDKLLARDVDFLLVCLRKVSYGTELKVQHTHDCKDANEHTYTVNVDKFIQNSQKINPTTAKKNFTILLPNDQKVQIKPITYDAFIKILQMTTSEEDANVSPESLRDIMVDSLSDVVVCVDEVTELKFIKQWLAQIPPSYLKQINLKMENTLAWGPDFITKCKCKDCGKMIEITAPLNPLIFFT